MGEKKLVKVMITFTVVMALSWCGAYLIFQYFDLPVVFKNPHGVVVAVEIKEKRFPPEKFEEIKNKKYQIVHVSSEYKTPSR